MLRKGCTQIETAEDLCQRSGDTVFVFPSFLTSPLRCLRQRCRLHHQGRWHDVRFVQIHYRNLNQHLGSQRVRVLDYVIRCGIKCSVRVSRDARLTSVNDTNSGSKSPTLLEFAFLSNN